MVERIIHAPNTHPALLVCCDLTPPLSGLGENSRNVNVEKLTLYTLIFQSVMHFDKIDRTDGKKLLGNCRLFFRNLLDDFSGP